MERRRAMAKHHIWSNNTSNFCRRHFSFFNTARLYFLSQRRYMEYDGVVAPKEISHPFGYALKLCEKRHIWFTYQPWGCWEPSPAIQSALLSVWHKPEAECSKFGNISGTFGVILRSFWGGQPVVILGSFGISLCTFWTMLGLFGNYFEVVVGYIGTFNASLCKLMQTHANFILRQTNTVQNHGLLRVWETGQKLLETGRKSTFQSNGSVQSVGLPISGQIYWVFLCIFL